MTREKQKKAGQTRLQQLTKAAKAFEGFRPASAVLTKVRTVPTRFIQFDHAVRVGGWPIERFSLVHGPSSHGKTLFCAGIIDSFLAADHFALHIDAERTSPIEWFETLMGQKAHHPGFFAERPDTYEDTIALTRNFCTTLIAQKEAGNVPPDTAAIIVVDSLRKLVPRDMMKEILTEHADAQDIKGGRDRSAQLKAKMNAAWMDEIVPLLEKAGAGMIAVGREMQDPDADMWAKKFGNDYKIGGGGAIYFDSSLVVRIERAAWVTHGEGKDRKTYGERHRATIKKTKVAGKDDKVAVGYFHSSNGQLIREGFDPARDLLELGQRLGVIDKSGAWYSFEGERIASGEHNAVVALMKDSDRLARIEVAARARLATVAPTEFDPETGELDS